MIIRLYLATLTTIFAIPAFAAETHVTVAANFAEPAKEIAASFEKATGHKAILAFGSSGAFFTQITQGAPFEIFLSADAERPIRAEIEGHTVAGTRFTYAIGRLVLWSRQPGAVDDKGEVLSSGRFERIALADPKLAPYGAAAVEVLRGLGLMSALAPKLVQGENIAQVYQFVATGNAELGFVALSQVFADGKLTKGSAWAVPASLHTPIRQDAIVLSAGKDKAAASALMAYLRNDKARTIIRSFGYDL